METGGGSDFGFGFGDLARFRVSVFRQKGHVGLVLRQIPTKMLTLEEIGLPAQMQDLLFKPRGLILVTGPTGSGKTTTLASMLNIINEERDCHIITVEDPIEYYHSHKKSVVTQREIGVDVPNFAEALRRALRQDPDVILVGEMRDLETMDAAITAAETGHLVFATLHTTGAARTVDRIVSAFPPTSKQVRTQLSSSIVAVISQILMPRKGCAGAHRGVRDHDRDRLDPLADSRQQDVPDHVRPANRGEVGDADAGFAPPGALAAGEDLPRTTGDAGPGPGEEVMKQIPSNH